MRGLIVGGKYRVGDRLATADKLVIHRATHLDLEHDVVVQLPRARWDPAWTRAFRREVRVLSKLRHPNIAEIHDFGQLQDGSPYLVVEYVDGLPLSLTLAVEPLDERRTVHLLRGIAHALRFAHQFGVHHLALVPANVITVESFDSESVKLLDFLSGRWHNIDPQHPSIPDFRVASPEVLRGEEPTSASDIYALGHLGWACLSGELAVPPDEDEARALHLGPKPWEVPSHWEVSEHFQHVLERCLQKEVHKRYETCHELLDDLEQWESASAATLKLPAVTIEQTGFFPGAGDIFAGKFHIEEMVGRGGFSRVFRAQMVGKQQPVALKILRPDRSASSVEARRFVREGKLVFTLLSNPHTISVFDYGETEKGLLYIAFEFIDGESFEELLERGEEFDPVRVVTILEQCLSSLAEAHGMGVLHRDIKTSNLMLSRRNGVDDWVTVLDFGIAKITSDVVDTTDLTLSGTAIGTPRYMPPEQLAGEPLGPESDLYSLGLVAYELLTGERAVQGKNTLEIVANQLDPQSVILPPKARVPAPLALVVNRLMRKDRKTRYLSAREVLVELRDLDREVGSRTIDTSTR